ncbi:WD repeat-containing protein 82 [Aulographum hederae CBS 113979]|uniref:WD repeat-containing protein 82 n=1 Tax=Aulographum hederae CBS 113979 TaxID=1176131 RepID=A0A6G1H9J8_9PEZI|nr:WD repeat-containing protein 82 [Aulographum hederae CBS 113979]
MASAKAPTTQKVSEVVMTFRPARHFLPGDNKSHVTSVDFDDSGELAILARSDDTLQIYNCKEGKWAKELKSQKYGVHLARYTHHAQSIVYASTKIDHNLRYLSAHDNTYLRYFKGHTDRVTCLALCPANDTFLSCSLDNTVRLWSVQSSSFTAKINLTRPTLAAYDPSASVIAIASPSTHCVLLYDLRNYDKPPFATFDLLEHDRAYNNSATNWSKLEFSNDGKSLVVGTAGRGHFVLDAFDGELKHFCQRDSTSERAAPGQAPAGASVETQGDMCIAPDGRYVIGGAGNGYNDLLVWDIHKESSPDRILMPESVLPGKEKAEIVAYNQRNNLICTADRDFYLWQPDPEFAP